MHFQRNVDFLFYMGKIFLLYREDFFLKKVIMDLDF